MPYVNDPRRRITLTFHPDDYAALTADATRAGFASAYAYVMALVQARGAALRPVVDEHGAQRMARMQGKLGVMKDALADCHAARAAEANQRRALERELAERPSRAEFQQLFAQAMETAMAERDAAKVVAPPTPAEAARAERRAARRPKE